MIFGKGQVEIAGVEVMERVELAATSDETVDADKSEELADATLTTEVEVKVPLLPDTEMIDVTGPEEPVGEVSVIDEVC
jgi:hypothetical protein